MLSHFSGILNSLCKFVRIISFVLTLLLPSFDKSFAKKSSIKLFFCSRRKGSILKSSKSTYCSFSFNIAQLFWIIVAQPYHPSAVPQRGSEKSQQLAKRRGVISRGAQVVFVAGIWMSDTFLRLCLSLNVLQIKVGQRRRESPPPGDLSWATPSERKQKCMSLYLFQHDCEICTRMSPSPRSRWGSAEKSQCLFTPRVSAGCRRWALLIFPRTKKANLGPEDVFSHEESRSVLPERVLSPPPSWSVSDTSPSASQGDSAGQLI